MNLTPHHAFVALLVLGTPLLFADTVTLSGGERKAGRILGMEGESLLLSCKPVPGLPPVTLHFHKSRLAALAFEEDPSLLEFLQTAGRDQLEELRSLWERFAPLLSIRGAHSARIGLRLGILQLGTNAEDSQSETLALFEKIAAAAPNPMEREAAKQGVLRSLLAGRHWERAETEAAAICTSPCGTPLLAEARLTVGLVQSVRLRAFVGENPRWRDDVFVQPERDRLHASALDHLLGTALLPGVPGELAARGLRAAMDVYILAGQTGQAETLATDLATFYAGSSEAVSALEWRESQPKQTPSKLK
jgi:hypothetical protein